MYALPYLHLAAFLVFVDAATNDHPIVSLFSYDGSEIILAPDPSITCGDYRECVPGDCYTGRICMPVNNQLQQIATVRCSADASTPYCNPLNGLCTSAAPSGCPGGDACPPIDGVYPVLSNCRRYLVCNGGVATVNDCPTNNVYDHNVGECVLQRRFSDCVTLNCNNRDGQMVVYPRDNSIYGTCVNGSPFLIGRCQSYERYDVSQKRCVRVCNRVENQPIAGQCRQYVRCSSIGLGRYEQVVHSCGSNEGFDPSLGRCSATAPCLTTTTTVATTTVATTTAATTTVRATTV